MAHYAFIKDNLVTEVITGKDETETAPDGFSDWEEYYLTKRPGQDACKRTSYNTNGNEHLLGGTPFRGNFAFIGSTYDTSNDVFIEAKPYDSWTLNNSTWKWEAPVALPDDAGVDDPENPTEIVEYTWDEDTTSWTNRTVVNLT